MDQLLEQLSADPWGRLIFHHVSTYGLWNCFWFLLVTARLAGVLLVAPAFVTTSIPVLTRAVLVVLLSLVITPVLLGQHPSNGDVIQAGHSSNSPMELPSSVTDLCGQVATEIGVGTLFGLGLIVIFSGIKLGGEWLDRHTGIGTSASGETGSSEDSVCSSLTLQLCIAAFLLIEPFGGPLLILQSLVQSFQTMPVGTPLSAANSIELLNSMVQQSLILGLRISMPLIATMMLVDSALAFASRGTPASLSASYVSIRTAVALFVLAMTMTTIPEVIVTTVASLQGSWN